jgi:hypothetical protein
MKIYTSEELRVWITIKNVIGIGLALLKAFFYAITNVAWGLVSLFAFNALITYLMVSQGQVNLVNPYFLKAEAFIIDNIMQFVWVFFILHSYSEIKDVIKN